MAFYTAFVGIWAARAAPAALGAWYLAGLGAAGLIALWHRPLIRDRSREGCFRAFRVNHWIGFTIWVGVVADLARHG